MTQGRAAALADSVVETGYTSLVLDRLARQACQITDAEQSSLLVCDPARSGAAIAVAACGVDDVVGSRLDATAGLTGQVLAEGKPLVSLDWPGQDEPGKAPVARAAAPVGWRERVRGALATQSADPLHRFGVRELAALEDLADFAAAALEHNERRIEVQSSVRPLMSALARAIDERDPYTAGHSEAVVELSCAVAERLGLGQLDVLELESAALMHDLGKITVTEAILDKPGPLSPEERAVVQRHPALGAELLATVSGMEPVATIVRFHHERWDGTGYPAGLERDQIPVASRIIGVCDAYHAMTSDRPYRRALSVDVAVRRLRAGAGSQFDPEVVECLVDALRETASEDETQCVVN